MTSRSRTTAGLSAVAVLAASVTFASLGVGDRAEAAAVTTFRPTADATVDAAAPSTPLGATTTLVADGSPVRVSYLRFVVSGVTTATSAHLRVHVRNTSVGPSPRAGAVSTVASTTWPEATVTWSTRPSAGTTIAAPAGPAVAGAWIDYDVSAAVKANGTFSFALTQADWDGLSLDAREGGTATAPQLVVEAGSTTTPPPSTAPAFDVALFGDVPYTADAATRYNKMIAAINAGTPRFSAHLGDIGTHLTACNTAAVAREVVRFDTFRRPVVYTPGDNEWADCGTAQASQLAYIRSQVFRGTGTLSRGATTLALESQAAAGYPENARWQSGNVTFATLHVVGSSDNGTNPAERSARQAAVASWIRASFAKAKARGDAGIVLLAQAEPRFATPGTTYRAIYDAVRAEALAFRGPVLYVHGDGHDYLNDRPMVGVPNLQRVQVEGSSQVSYVTLRIDPAAASLFQIVAPRRF